MSGHYTIVLVLLGFVAVALTSARRDHVGPSHAHHHYYGDVNNHASSHSSEQDGSDVTEEHDDHIYRFQIGPDHGAYEYLDSEGYLRGFYVDMVLALCQYAGKRCYYTYDTYDHCWRNRMGNEAPGIGLLDQWYDGCVGMQASRQRLNAFNFTLPFTTNYKVRLHYALNATVEHPENIQGKRIGLLDGWVVSKMCLERQGALKGNHKNEYEPVFFDSHRAMIAAVNSGQIDAMLTMDLAKMDNFGLQSVGPRLQCTEGGLAVMAPYGSDVIEWWNEAFVSFRNSGEFAQLCEQANIKHAAHGSVECQLW